MSKSLNNRFSCNKFCSKYLNNIDFDNCCNGCNECKKNNRHNKCNINTYNQICTQVCMYSSGNNDIVIKWTLQNSSANH